MTTPDSSARPPMTDPHAGARTVTFDELLEHGRKHGKHFVNGVPWSFEYNGWPVSHENDDCYLVTLSDRTLRVNRGESVVIPEKALQEYLGALWESYAEWQKIADAGSVPHAGASPEARPPRDIWVCATRRVSGYQCGAVNDPDAEICAVCWNPRFEITPAPVSARVPLSDATAAPTPSEPRPVIAATEDHPAIYRDGHRLTATAPAVPLTSGSEGQPDDVISQEEAHVASRIADGYAWVRADKVRALLVRIEEQRKSWRTALASARSALDAKDAELTAARPYETEICGWAPGTRLGCGRPILTCKEVYRCADCEVPFHRNCAIKHFGREAGSLASARAERDKFKQLYEMHYDGMASLAEDIRRKDDALASARAALATAQLGLSNQQAALDEAKRREEALQAERDDLMRAISLAHENLVFDANANEPSSRADFATEILAEAWNNGARAARSAVSRGEADNGNV